MELMSAFASTSSCRFFSSVQVSIVILILSLDFICVSQNIWVGFAFVSVCFRFRFFKFVACYSGKLWNDLYDLLSKHDCVSIVVSHPWETYLWQLRDIESGVVMNPRFCRIVRHAPAQSTVTLLGFAFHSHSTIAIHEWHHTKSRSSDEDQNRQTLPLTRVWVIKNMAWWMRAEWHINVTIWEAGLRCISCRMLICSC